MEFPLQQTGKVKNPITTMRSGAFDMRDALAPRRLTIVMWDQTFLLRHAPGCSFQNYDQVLDETIERGYNTLRLDPMPQLLDMSKPEMVFGWADPKLPYMPWGYNQAGEGPLGTWLIEFMEKVLTRRLHYTLSAWWSDPASFRLKGLPESARLPRSTREAAEMWIVMLHDWKKRFGFEGLVYVDVANETPYFLSGFLKRIQEETGHSWKGEKHEDMGLEFSDKLISFVGSELNGALSSLQREFPELRFTFSIHGDERWLDIPLQFDCLDVHFYADIDARWRDRTRFTDCLPGLFTDASWHKEFSDRCRSTHQAVAPMLRACQRSKLASFTAWAEKFGMPLTTSESWASWYYYDSPNLDWNWLLDWAEWSVEDAIEYRMWGWTPHNYCQPQFVNWRDARWHHRLTEKFLRS